MKNYDSIPRNIVPEKRVLPGFESPEITKRKNEFSKLLLKGDFEEISPQNRPTILDFQGLSPESTEKDFFGWIEKEIGIKQEALDGNNKESIDAYRILNHAYQRGKDFLKDVLKYKEAEISIGPESISSKEDIVNLLNKTISVAGNSGLSKALLYCRLAKATVIAYETLKHDAELLKVNAGIFEDALISPVSEVEARGAPLILLKETEKGKQFYAADHGGLKGRLTTRGKNFQKAMLRFVTRPESSAASALKDGIASRITIEEKQAIELLPILCTWLTENMKVSFIKIENQTYFSHEEVKEVEQRLLEIISSNSFSITEGKLDSSSMGNFKAFKMMGILQLPEKEGGPISVHARQFEIQLVSPNNKNESGQMDHRIFDVKKFVIARTRLDGGCPESVFDEFVKEASRESGISEKKIIYFLTEVGDEPIVKLKKKNNKKGESIYVAYSVYSRWNEFGFVDGSLVKDIERAKK